MNIKWHPGLIEKVDRENLNGHKGFCLWFTGLSGSGKSSIAAMVEKLLFDNGIRTFILDGDNIRHGLSNDLGFSQQDIRENNRRISEVAKLFVDAGIVVIVALISPFIKDRKNTKKILSGTNFVEIFIDADLSICQERDKKGLYAKAKSGEINGLIGISIPYERPRNPDLTINTNYETSITKNAEKIIEYLVQNGFVKK